MTFIIIIIVTVVAVVVIMVSIIVIIIIIIIIIIIAKTSAFLYQSMHKQIHMAIIIYVFNFLTSNYKSHESRFLNPPHNDREKKRKATLVIKMNGNQTVISDPANMKDQKKFAFDYSYWSHDGFKEESNGYLSPKEPKYADQVFMMFFFVCVI